MLYFKNPSNISSAIAIWWSTGQQTGFWWSRSQQAGDIDLLLDALDQQFTTHQVRGLSLGWTLKINEISMNLQYPKNHQTSVPKHLKVSEMRSKEGPEIIKFMKKTKNEI